MEHYWAIQYIWILKNGEEFHDFHVWSILFALESSSLQQTLCGAAAYAPFVSTCRGEIELSSWHKRRYEVTLKRQSKRQSRFSLGLTEC